MIWNPLRLIFTEPNITLLNLVSGFKKLSVGIDKEITFEHMKRVSQPEFIDQDL